MVAPEPAGAPSYPPSPWHLHGSLWLTMFRLARDVDERHPAGLYGAAFVDYTEPSPLTYGEVLVARAMTRAEGRGQRVTIIDIWVDSPASEAGGRALWAIPKGLARFTSTQAPSRLGLHARWTADLDGQPVAQARFADAARLAPRLPFRATAWQPGLPEGGGDKEAVMAGTARMAPTRARWTFAAAGPLGFLAPARQLASVRLTDFRMTFGG